MLALALPGCRKTTAASGPTASASTSSSAPRSAASASSGSSPGLIPHLGLPARAAIAEDAEKENDAGFKLHAKKQYPESRDAFRRALAKDDDFTMARYNLACAYVRLGDLDQAEVELARVLREDLPTYRRGLERDADLAALRASPPHVGRLRAFVERLEKDYRVVLARGLRSTLWAPSSAGRWGTNADQRVLAQPSVLRVGVFDSATTRFVPLAPAPKKPLAAVWGPEVPYAIVATGTWNPYCGGDMCQWIEDPAAEIFDDSLSGEPVARLAARGQAGGAFVEWSGGEASLETFFAFATNEKDNGTFVHTWSPGSGVKTKRYGFGGADAPKRSALPRSAKHLIGPTGVDSVREGAGISWDAKAKTLKLASGDVVVVTDLPSKVNPPHAVLSPDGRRALVVWDNAPPCDPDHDHTAMTVHHAVLFVDFDGTVTRVSDKEGMADATFDPRGDAYVQADTTLSRLGAGLALEPLPRGVLLSPPTVHHWGCVGFW
jgi:hypothetical protein